MFDTQGSPMSCSPLVNPQISLPWAPAHRYPGVLQSLGSRDALGGVYGQHLVDEIFCFRSDRVPFRGGELPKQREGGETWRRVPLHLGQIGELVATGKSCQVENQKAGVEEGSWKAQDKTCLSHKVALKCANVCTADGNEANAL